MRRLITPQRIKIIAPIKIAITEVSPMLPAIIAVATISAFIATGMPARVLHLKMHDYMKKSVPHLPNRRKL